MPLVSGPAPTGSVRATRWHEPRPLSTADGEQLPVLPGGDDVALGPVDLDVDVGDVAEEARRGGAEVAGRIGELGVRARAARVGVARDGQRLLWRPPGGGDLHVLATDGCATAVVLGDEPATSDRDRGTGGRRAGGQHRGGGIRGDDREGRVDDRRGGLRSGPRRPGR